MKNRVVPIRSEPRWRAASPKLKAAIGELTELIASSEQRQRQRRPRDTSTFRSTVECICCNLLAISAAAPDRPLAIPLANAASKLSPLFGKPARNIVDLMVQLGLITKVRGYPYLGPTTIQPTSKLRKHLPLEAIRWQSLRLEDHAEMVVLKPRPTDLPDEDDEDVAPIRRAKRVDEQAEWLRTITEQVHEINAAILAAGIECKGSAVAHISERPGAAMASLVTLHHRTLRRIFNGGYDEGGRLFGGFYQTMPRPDRFKQIKIDGEPVAICDWGQLFLRLAYAEAGATPPPGDLYDLTGRDATRPGWKALREARKKLVNALFFKRKPLKQWPGKSIADFEQMREAFPAGTKPLDAIKAIREKHAPIDHLFEQGHGLRFMRTESDLIVAVTLTLLRRGIVALPIHDAVAIPNSCAAIAKAVMQAEAKRLTGADIPVDVQGSLHALSD